MSKKLQAKSFFKIIMLVISFRLLLDYGYIKFVYPLFEYSGFNYEFNLTKLFISWFVIVLVFLIVFLKKRSALIYIYFLIYSITVVPNSSYYALSGSSEQSFWATTIVFTLILIFIPARKKKYSYENGLSQKKRNIIITIIAIISSVNLLYLIYSTRGQYVLSFEDVYEFRADNTASYSGIFGYLNNWTPKIFVPFLIAVGFIRKSRIVISSSMMFCLLLFAFTGHKSILLPVILCVFLSLAFKSGSEDRYFERFSILCLSGLIAISAMGVGWYLWDGELFLGSILFRRAFFVPVYLNDIYFDMFSDLYDPIYWSNGLLSSFSIYPYGNEPITRIVGAYLNLPNLNANTGFIASGFMQARYIGMALYTFILIVINIMLARVSNRINPLMFNAILLLPFLTLFSSSDLPTTMLTHGLLIAIIILYLYSGVLKFSTSSQR
ncbi:hypothetical protein [Psychrobacter sp. UBA2514]|jgi:hypothetical protein|uniref:hypothetical protein n=1 Tax=Psychrobacter sp. UBA2514 TaxID=1947346 RepID=UPI002580CF1B|nr:hypothetical protein [Psychrobacter sp. UBA2514]|tara:strand:+ start:15990 stop:17303 length:1314 start_codon:yes stop_codon:yes gene_type:complete